MSAAGEATDGASRRRIDLTSYRPDHGELLRELPSSPATTRVPLGGVVVPTSRDLRPTMPGIELGARLALGYDCPLVVITSQNAEGRHLPAWIRESLGRRLVVVDLGEVSPDWHAPLATRSHPLEKLCRPMNDVGLKRNLGISIAVAMRRGSVLFLDDDVSSPHAPETVDGAGLARALQALRAQPDLKAVGWSMNGFPDNSVAGHTRRLVPGLAQSVFVGGGALLTRMAPDTPFFPDIYNEDWLFLHALARRGTSADFTAVVRKAGSVDQRVYDPFIASRARAEEAGEVMAEGLMNLLEEDRSQLWDQEAHWDECIRRRRRMLLHLIDEVRETPKLHSLYYSLYYSEPVLRRRVEESLHAALQVNENLVASEFTSYLALRQDDLTFAWPEHLAGLRKGGLAALPRDDVLVRRLLRCEAEHRRAPAVDPRGAATRRGPA